MKLADALEEFLLNQQIKGNSPYTLKFYKNTLGMFVAKQGADCQTEAIKQADLNQYYISLISREIASTTIQTYVRALRAFLNWCYAEGYTPACLPDKFRLPKAKRNVIDILTPGEIKTLLASFNRADVIQNRNYCMVILMLDSGLRMNEVINMRLSSVRLQESYVIVDGKGNKQRIIPIGLNTRKALLKYMSVRPPVLYDNVFLTVNNEPVRKSTVNNIFRKFRRRTGITRLRAHLLRHTFATLYLENGGDIYSLQSILGHTSLDMVKKYIHTTPRKTVVNFGNFSPVDNLAKT